MAQLIKSVVVDDLWEAISIAGVLVQEMVESINCEPYHSDTRRYHPYMYSHFALLMSKEDKRVTADYYAYLQSFASDFEMSLPETAAAAIAAFSSSNQVENALNSHTRTGVAEVAEYLFIQNAELNPYLCFMRGHFSAYTVIAMVVVNLQLALAHELLNATARDGETTLPSTYFSKIKSHFNQPDL